MSEIQRLADSVARRLLAEQMDRDPFGASPGSDNGLSDNGTDEPPLLRERQVIPPLSDVDRQSRVKVG